MLRTRHRCWLIIPVSGLGRLRLCTSRDPLVSGGRIYLFVLLVHSLRLLQPSGTGYLTLALPHLGPFSLLHFVSGAELLHCDLNKALSMALTSLVAVAGLTKHHFQQRRVRPTAQSPNDLHTALWTRQDLHLLVAAVPKNPLHLVLYC